MPYEIEIHIDTGIESEAVIVKRFSSKAVADVELDKIVLMGCREIDAEHANIYRIWPAHKIDHIIVKEV